ncbi:uncharacterized protein PFL1_06738 [Pseudozyma flocculosa PF-1]|uniref:Acyl-coenzyme A oxidase n=2 Tax=Pseudozyma flocculosa TaxID=84751 RepID=A0A5C3F7R4_9BASI|nr:uncharacterized protein PFL1_06738 [Pseudozyma flocculosa PF-1]EPQ25666.1 hypothetical protein PFL1_06738 [Pseudozyma flocculosa PF-1]SPO40442.1 related to acyl-coenzyme A oxidase 1 [Pseudozyma flocculosa]
MSAVNSRPTPESLQPKDLAQERQQCSFSIDALSCLVPGGRQHRDHARWLLSLLKDDPDKTFDKERRVFQSRNARFFNGQKVALRYFEIRNRHGLDKKDADALRLLTDEYLPVQVSESMFQPTLMRQASEQQWQEWGPMVRSGRWLGCYMQTELAHGSNLSALRTTATLDTATDEWVIHTPEPSAGKTWIGGSGLTATHGVVMANLVIAGKPYGMHPLLVPLRSLEDHTLLPGRQAIDMGPKQGAPAMDNGYVCFDSVRVPRTNLLSRFQTVSREGKYEPRNAQAKTLTRGTMTLVRVGLCEIASHHLARACTIAVRYAVVRRQGSSSTPGSQLEPKILDYSGVQQRVLTAVASAYALTFASQHLRGIYERMMSELEAKGSSPLLPIVHGYSSVLKAAVTNESLAAIERCRRSMGGHGFSQASGFDFERNQPNAGLIYEGENSMLLAGPAANFLVKQLAEARKAGTGTRMPELVYLDLVVEDKLDRALQRGRQYDEIDLSTPEKLLDILGCRAAKLVSELDKLRSSTIPALSKGRSGDGAKSHMLTDLSTRASLAHAAYLISHSFYLLTNRLVSQHLHNLSSQYGATITQAHRTALEDVLVFYLLQNCLLSPSGLVDLLEYDILTPAQVQTCRAIAATLMSGPIRRDAVGLVEAFDMDDWYLCSPLGSSDGRAYERMIEWMKREPLNQSGEDGGREQNGAMKGYRDGVGRLIRGEAVQFAQKSKL